MSTEKYVIANPYNEKHLQLFEEFETKNHFPINTTNYLREKASLYSKTEYDQIIKKSNNIEQILFLEDDGSIVDTCHIQGEKDRKICTIYFAQINTFGKNRSLLNLSSDYALNILGMEEIMVTIKNTDKILRDNLENMGFESLGENDGDLIFIKGKETVQKVSRRIH